MPRSRKKNTNCKAKYIQYYIMCPLTLRPRTSLICLCLCQSEKTNSAIRNKVSRTFFFLLEGWALVGFVRVAHNIEQLQMGRTQAHVGKKFLKRFNENSTSFGNLFKNFFCVFACSGSPRLGPMPMSSEIGKMQLQQVGSTRMEINWFN